MTIEIVNPVDVDAIPGWVRAMATPFLVDPEDELQARYIARIERRWDGGRRAWGARDAGRWVGTLCTMPQRLTVPGLGGDTRDLDVDALTMVTVTATHRRRGLMSRMLGGSLRAARDRGDAVSILTSAGWPIYGRFGYAPATFSAGYTIDPRAAGARVAGDLTRVRQVDRAGAGEIGPELYERARRRRAGQLDRGGSWWPFRLGLDVDRRPEATPMNWIAHDGDDGPDGLLAWTPREHDDGTHTITADELVAATDGAYRDLWAYLTGIELVAEVSIPERPVDEPVRWLMGDGRALRGGAPVDHTWVKLLDVPAALAARRYTTAGELVLDVADDSTEVPVAGRYRLRADGDEVDCAPTSADPDLAIDARALASIYLGGVDPRALIAAGRAAEARPGAADRAAAMFSTPTPPWNATDF